jgi:hypothetical protein
MRYLDDPHVPIDNNWCENQIRPIAAGRNNWLFAGSLRAGRRAAAVMSLVQSAKMNGHAPYAYLKDVLARLPMQPAARLDELLPRPGNQRRHKRRNCRTLTSMRSKSTHPCLAGVDNVCLACKGGHRR